MIFDHNAFKLMPFKPKNFLKHYISDIVYGATDGIVTSFVLVSGVQGAHLSSSVVIILGLVNLFADGISMGAANFLSIRTDAKVKNVDRGYLEPLQHALMTLTSFIVFGSIPLISFLIPGFFAHSFGFSILMTAVALFFVGTLRVFISKERWYQGALEMLVIGGIASLIAYYIGYGVSLWIK